MSNLPIITKEDLGDQVPRRNGTIAPFLGHWFLKLRGWKITGEIPNIPQAVFLAVPHTSNIDGLQAIPMLLALNLQVNIMGKKSLLEVPILGPFLKWAGVIAIDRSKKGTVLQASIDRFKTGKPLYLALAPEGTRSYRKELKTGFYYLAVGAEVPIIPVSMCFRKKEVQFLEVFHPTGDIDADMPEILDRYKDVTPKYFEKMAQPLQDVNIHLQKKVQEETKK